MSLAIKTLQFIREPYRVLFRLFSNSTDLMPNSDSMSSSIESKHETVNHLKRLEELDLSTFRPIPPPAGAIHAFLEYSAALQKLVHLGVNLSVVSKKRRDVAEFITRCSFKRDIQPLLSYFINDIGVSEEEFGKMIINDPSILLDGQHGKILKTVRYLNGVGFTKEDVRSMFLDHTPIATMDPKNIDKSLQHYQAFFYFTGSELRDIAVRNPAILTVPYPRVRFMEGFFRRSLLLDRSQVHSCMMVAPALLTQSIDVTTFNFVVLHHEQKMEVEQILAAPQVLTAHPNDLTKRLNFLARSGRAQFDPTKPLYTSPLILASASDNEFVASIPGHPISYDLFQNFLRSQ